jgi:hypothetical protein
MPRDRFEAIKSNFRIHPIKHDLNDPWFPVRNFVEKYNETRKKLISPGWLVVVDESMSPWKGKGLPHLSYLPNKPVKYGVELKTIACAESGVILGIEIQVRLFKIQSFCCQLKCDTKYSIVCCTGRKSGDA